MLRRKGKYTKIDPNNPKALGRCDTSGFLARYEDLQKQMAYVGNQLIWTGFLVLPDYLDEPNPQGLAPKIKPDPVPVKNPRPDDPDENVV